MNQFQLLFKSLYLIQTIKYARFVPITKAIVHILLVTLLIIIPPSIMLVSSLQHGVTQLQSILHEDIPSFQIVDGHLQLEEHHERPYITDALIDGVFILDDTGTVTEKDLSAYQNGVALLKTEMIFLDNGHMQAVQYQFSGIHSLSPTELQQSIEQFQGVFFIFVFLSILVMYVGFAGFAYIGISLLATIGLLLRPKEARLTYKALWSMAAIAMTMPAVAFSIIDSLLHSVPILLLIMITIGLYVFSLYTLPKTKKKGGG
ncbi:DUF1189 domain-containing protein [Halalkalibacterium halodurans]|uniref:DUF1189 domain-containing protein n=1 Tax=Halalkalibacterium halodurans TaxID=86665 RepID=UPI002AAA4301|nr:DUF1189 domain-containing protein [Halalkalibacterium halodurans]MDY7221930.1 DUF1189 domain-containing protein [Halalkalibacterium halodurans]MDY7241206.1 DUF1189 domain-containing protein [Halalkalibacterium halodurans]